MTATTVVSYIHFVRLFQWFNLNSLQKGPELISDTYLKMFLTQLQLEGEEGGGGGGGRKKEGVLERRRG